MSEVVRLVELGDGDMMVMSSEFKVSSLTLGTAKKLEKTILAIMQAERTLHADQCNAMSVRSRSISLGDDTVTRYLTF